MNETRLLIVMRHSKAGELPGGPDFDRPLKPRGRRDAVAGARWLRAAGYQPDTVLCSAARRTAQTWQRMSGVLCGSPVVSLDERLYEADADDVIQIVAETAANVATLLYVGHNPAAAGVVGILTGAEPHFPTSAIAVVAVPAAWDELAPGDGELVAAWTPRPA